MAERRKRDRRRIPILPIDVDKIVGENFTREQQHALQLVWGLNALTLEEAKATIESQGRLLRRGLLALLVLMAVIGTITIRLQIVQGGEAHRIQTAEQTSRFDSSYSACEKTNARHAAALIEAAPLTRLNPAAGALAIDLINTLAPLRDGQDGRLSCATYAAQQTALHIPAPFAPPRP